MSMEQRYQGLGGVKILKMHVVLKEWTDYSPAAAENCLVVREHPSICQVNKTKSNVWKVQSMNMLHVTRMLESPPQKELVFQLLEICKQKVIQIGYDNCFFFVWEIKTFCFRDSPHFKKLNMYRLWHLMTILGISAGVRQRNPKVTLLET